MQSNLDQFSDLDIEDDVVTDSDLVGYFSPKSVVDDPELSISRKRALLAHWASDIHAIPSAPALRAVMFVPTTSIDAIMAAMALLDEMVDGAVLQSNAGMGSAAA